MCLKLSKLDTRVSDSFALEIEIFLALKAKADLQRKAMGATLVDQYDQRLVDGLLTGMKEELTKGTTRWDKRRVPHF